MRVSHRPIPGRALWTALAAVALLAACAKKPPPKTATEDVAAAPPTSDTVVHGDATIAGDARPTDAANPDASPLPGKVELPEKKHHAGDVVQGQSFSHTFRIKNIGKGVLELKRAQGTWGCTAAIISEAAIPPGGEGKVKVTVSSAGHSGRMAKTITVYTNDPDTPKHRLTLSADIIVEVGFEHPYLDTGEMQIGKVWKGEAPIIARDMDKLRLGEVNSQTKGLTGKVKLKRGPKGEKRYVLAVRWLPQGTGNVRGQIRVKTNHDKAPQITLAVYGNITGPVSVAPQQVVLTGSGEPATVLVRSEKRGFRVRKVTEPLGQVLGKIQTLKKRKIYKVLLRPSPKALKAKRPFRAKVQIHTGIKVQPVVELFVLFRPMVR